MHLSINHVKTYFGISNFGPQHLYLFILNICIGKDRSLPRRETYDEFGNGYNYANPKRRNRRMKRTPNLGQAMEKSIGKAMGRVKRRVGEIIAARDEEKRRVEDNRDGILLQERKSGLTGLSEDLPLELTSIETNGKETLDFTSLDMK